MKHIMMATLGAVVGLATTATSAFGGLWENEDGSKNAWASTYEMLAGTDDGDVVCSGRNNWSGGCYFYNGGGNLVCYDLSHALDNFKGLTPGSYVRAEFDADGNCERLSHNVDSREMRLYYELLHKRAGEKVVEEVGELTCSSEGTGADFVCTDACDSASVALAAGANSGSFGTNAAVWFEATAPVNGWQASNTAGRTITVNGVVVTPGGALPSPTPEGKYYFHFSAGAYSYATWSYW